MSFRRTRAVFRKEIRHILRDGRSLGLALAVPVLMIVLFGYALSLDVDRIPTLVYDQDRTSLSRELIHRFAGSRYFEIVGVTDSYAPIERAIDRNRALLAVVIPPGYSEELAAGREPRVQLLLDGSDSNTASIALGYAESLIRGYAFELRNEALDRKGGQRIEPPVDPRFRVLYNSRLVSKNYIVPGLIAVILMVISALLTSMTIAREWEMGTMEQLLSTPLRAPEMVLGKMLAYFLVGIVDALLAVGIGVFLFEVPLRGSIWLLGATGCLFVTGAMLWGILLSAIAKSQLVAFQMGMLSTFLPAFLLSGFVYAIESMPRPIQAITHIFPARYFVTILKGIFLKGVGVEVLWVEIVFLLAFAAIVFALATRKLGSKLA